MSPLLTPKEVALLLSVSNKTIYRLASAGDLPSIRIAGTLRFRPEDIETYITSNRSGAATEDPKTSTETVEGRRDGRGADEVTPPEGGRVVAFPTGLPHSTAPTPTSNGHSERSPSP